MRTVDMTQGNLSRVFYFTYIIVFGDLKKLAGWERRAGHVLGIAKGPAEARL